MTLSQDDIQKQSIQLTARYSQILTTLASAMIAGLLAFYHNIAQSVNVNLTVLTIGLAILAGSLVAGLMAYGNVIYRLVQLFRSKEEFSTEDWTSEERERKKTMAYQGGGRFFAFLQFIAFVIGNALLVATLA